MVILGGWVFLMSDVPLYPPPRRELHAAHSQTEKVLTFAENNGAPEGCRLENFINPTSISPCDQPRHHVKGPDRPRSCVFLTLSTRGSTDFVHFLNSRNRTGVSHLKKTHHPTCRALP